MGSRRCQRAETAKQRIIGATSLQYAKQNLFAFASLGVQNIWTNVQPRARREAAMVMPTMVLASSISPFLTISSRSAIG